MFESFEAVLYPIVSKINTYLSNYVLIFLLIGVGVFHKSQNKFIFYV